MWYIKSMNNEPTIDQIEFMSDVCQADSDAYYDALAKMRDDYEEAHFQLQAVKDELSRNLATVKVS